MVDTAPGQVTSIGHCVVLTLAIDGDLRFISHRDCVRLLGRAMLRARLPVVYTQGFNPRIKMSLPVPRPVGIACDGDPLILHLRSVCSESRVARTLAENLPQGARVISAAAWPHRRNPRLTTMAYQLSASGQLPADLPARVQALLHAGQCMVQRRQRDGTVKKPVDVRPFIRQFTVAYNTIEFELQHLDGRCVGAREVLCALQLPYEHLRHQIRRTRVEWN